MGFCELVKAAMGEVVDDFVHDADVGGVLGHGGTFFLIIFYILLWVDNSTSSLIFPSQPTLQGEQRDTNW